MRKIPQPKQCNSMTNQSRIKQILTCNEKKYTSYYKSILSSSQVSYLDEAKKYCLVSSDYLAEIDCKHNQLKEKIQELEDENEKINQLNRLMMAELINKDNYIQQKKGSFKSLQKINIELREKIKINNSMLQELGDQIMKLVRDNNSGIFSKSQVGNCYKKQQTKNKHDIFVQTNFSPNQFKCSFFTKAQIQSLSVPPTKDCIRNCCLLYQQKMHEFNAKIDQINLLFNQKTDQLNLLEFQIERHKSLNKKLIQQRQEIKKQRQNYENQKQIISANWKQAMRKLSGMIQRQWQDKNQTVNSKSQGKLPKNRKQSQKIQSQKNINSYSSRVEIELAQKYPSLIGKCDEVHKSQKED